MEPAFASFGFKHFVQTSWFTSIRSRLFFVSGCSQQKSVQEIAQNI